jgi:hypothetical protein
VSKSKTDKQNDLQNTTQKATEYLSQMTNECSLCGSHNLELIASFMAYFTEFFYIVTGKMALADQELLTITKHPSSILNFSGFHVAQSLIFCVVFS